MVQLEVLEEQQQQSRDALHDDLFVSVHVDAQFHALQNGDAGMEGKKHRGCGSREAKGTVELLLIWMSSMKSRTFAPLGLPFPSILPADAKMH